MDKNYTGNLYVSAMSTEEPLGLSRVSSRLTQIEATVDNSCKLAQGTADRLDGGRDQGAEAKAALQPVPMGQISALDDRLVTLQRRLDTLGEYLRRIDNITT